MTSNGFTYVAVNRAKGIDGWTVYAFGSIGGAEKFARSMEKNQYTCRVIGSGTIGNYMDIPCPMMGESFYVTKRNCGFERLNGLLGRVTIGTPGLMRPSDILIA